MHEAMVVGFGRIEKGATHIISKICSHNHTFKKKTPEPPVFGKIYSPRAYYNCRSYSEWGLYRKTMIYYSYIFIQLNITCISYLDMSALSPYIDEYTISNSGSNYDR